MRRLFAILLIAAAGIFAACNDVDQVPGSPDVSASPDAIPTDLLPTDAVSPSPTVAP